MSERNDGILAFPLGSGDMRDPAGMLLRDYFAAKALAALINHPNKDFENRGPRAVPKLAKWAYEYADAMLIAREDA